MDQAINKELPEASGDKSGISPFAIVLICVLFVLIGVYFYRKKKGPPQRPVVLPNHNELRKLREKHLENYLSTVHDEGAIVEPILRKKSDNDNEGNKLKILPTVKEERLSKKGRRLSFRDSFSNPPRKYQPLKTPTELLEWQRPPRDIVIQVTRSFRLISRHTSGVKKILVVHDMAGNYAEDAHVDGWYSRTLKETKDYWVWGYRISHFHWVDVFIYFSHSLVTIPPRGWIDAAHRHGTPVLGTFITEWEEGSQFCKEIFSTEESTLKACHQLTEIRKFYGFDGWLINIENKLLAPEMIENMYIFLENLSSSGNIVIWYDSVISETGELKWQNELNQKNLEFYLRANNGILTNYGWNEHNVENSNALATERSGDNSKVWHGIDVFGRNTFGGGGLNCDLALNALDKLNSTSACLFAPGWVMENLSDRNPLIAKSNNLVFWDKILKNTSFVASITSHDSY